MSKDPYAWVTAEMFDEKLVELLGELTPQGLLAIAGIYEILAEHYNNEILEALCVNRDTPTIYLNPTCDDGGCLVSILCRSESDAQAMQQELAALDGTPLERDGQHIYATCGAPGDEGTMQRIIDEIEEMHAEAGWQWEERA